MDAGFSFQQLGNLVSDPSALVETAKGVANDPRTLVSEVGLRTRFGDIGRNPWDGSPPHEGSEGGAPGLSVFGRALLRILGAKAYTKTAVGEVVVDLTP